MTQKQVYLFEEGNAKMRSLLGSKGANLCEMTNIGLPVPPGFVITTEVCNEYSRQDNLPPNLMKEVEEKLRVIEKKSGKEFACPNNPLLLSVRSGAAFSMPGMMDTVLNLGLNDKTILGLIKRTKDERFAYDAYRRVIMMFSNVVLGMKRDKFEKILEKYKYKLG